VSEAPPPVLLLALNWGGSDEMGAMTPQAMALPLEFAHLSTELGLLGVEHTFIDCWARNCSIADVRADIQSARFVVVCSSPSYLFWRDGVINVHLVTRSLEEIKQINPGITTILIGPHGTVVPESFNGKPIDYLFKGEPDLNVPKLIANLIANVPGGDQLPGVIKQKDGRFESVPGGIEVDLAALAPVNLSKFRLEDYTHPPIYGDVPKGKIATVYEASRGCPYSCIYCFKVNFRDKFRAKPLERIDEELRDLAARNVGYVYLIDEIFFKDRVWSTEVMKMLKKYNIRFGCQTRPVLITKEMVDAIIEYGMAGLIQIGLEHTDAEVLKIMRKGDTNLKALGEQLHRLADANISIDLFLVTGLPGDTREKILAMSEIFENFPMHHIKTISHGAMPLPGTKLWQMGQDAGHDLKDWDDVGKMKGMIGTKFKDPDEMALAAFQLNGRIRAIEDRQNIARGHRGIRNYVKLAKHSLDNSFPRVMRAVTGLKQKLS
jgi:radical SAM superfamily enzyme YgiQ (UPF0313 family)